ncbi:conserved Plasmodium protein, unknown function [Plasmodium berghei]|nr:conserved Plasmodium protein, unknown function [Plasmodium berghei]SCM15402.1 conserved Plasmodium protein, unknown function [Plasmodium berghei]SCN22253.1 conserved Plasmodium protein, unknown function [Plasmodium berghei]
MKTNINALLKSEEEKEQGNILFKQGDYELSIFHYTRSINYVPTSSILYTNRSLAYYKIGAYDKSLNDAIKAKELDPNNLKSYYRICESYKALKDFKNFEKYTKIYNNKKNSIQNEQNNENEKSNDKETNLDKFHSQYIKNKINEKNYEQKVIRNIKKSSELINLCQKDEKENFLFFNTPQIENKKTNISFEKKEYKQNFLIEEIYDFKNPEKETKNKNNDISINNNSNKKNDNSKNKTNKLSYIDIYNDIICFTTKFTDLFLDNTLLSVYIQKENIKTKNYFGEYDLKKLKEKADILFSQKKYIYSIDIYNDVLQSLESEKGIYYCTVLNNRSVCFIEMKKNRSALCDICKTLNILFSFFEQHKEKIKNIQNEEKNSEQLFYPIDIDIYNDINGIYYQAHKILIKLLFRYIKFSHFYSSKFKLASIDQVSIFMNMKGMEYLDRKEVEKLKDTVYSKL